MALQAVSFEGVYELGPERFYCAVLREQNQGRLLPIWVSPVAAAQLGAYASGLKGRRPGTHELLADALGESAGGVASIGVTGCHEGVFMAAIALADGGVLDARASDALTLAQVMELPISVDSEVLDQYAVFVPEAVTEEYFHTSFEPPAAEDAAESDSASGDAQADADFAAMMRELGVSEEDLTGLRGDDDEGDNEGKD
ncbi:hypothetical protein CATYP_05535 [Corynebacterium atypicum]|uniref:BFN domain-containing protein n=1 Tax=Corynebacterium atypicum TaxID=191610 RepID=A0ABM5QN11_9CORY|nr:bifunctional nuclease family protein [Corynebacterium atypicum]AIG64166.1 hypothetical protein CATYP_05535 [Corynebacterium atypicum]